jgi:hypothetical protein
MHFIRLVAHQLAGIIQDYSTTLRKLAVQQSDSARSMCSTGIIAARSRACTNPRSIFARFHAL